MTKLLQQAFERASELPLEEQDKFAHFLLAELESEWQWAELFGRPESEDLLERLAACPRNTGVEWSGGIIGVVQQRGAGDEQELPSL